MTFLAGLLVSLALLFGCADTTEQRLKQVQKDLEYVLGTALVDGDIRMQRTNDHLTVVMTERLLFEAGSYTIKPDGIELLKRMNVLFKTSALKEIRVAGYAGKASLSDHSTQYFEKLALAKARATQTVRALRGDGSDSQSFKIEWYGDSRPVAGTETEGGRQMDRRVEIVLYARI